LVEIMTPDSSYNRRAVVSWVLYDFANSPFTTLVVTFAYATYFTRAIVGDETLGTTLWSRGVAATAIAVALLSPLAGALADRGGHRKALMLAATVVSVGATALLFFPTSGQIGRALFLFVIANVAFEMGVVFYNAFLPDIAPASRVGRVSGWGWSAGYLGGLACLVLALVGFVQAEVPWFDLSREGGENVRATNLLVAVWFAVFSIPAFLWLREDKSRASPAGTPLLRTSIRQLQSTFREIGKHQQVLRLLVARLIYNDGLVTIFAFGAIYAQGTFGFGVSEILIFGIVLNVTAGLGAFIMGFLDDVLGGKRMIEISIAGMFVATLLAVLSPTKAGFWIAGILVGCFAGPNQSASRSLLARFVPPEKANELFGFYAFSGKATAFLGPLLLGTLTAVFGSQRAGLVIVLFFFGAGWLVLRTVNEAEGIRLAGRDPA
jgi:UMF1 family MFS transporter